MSYQDIFYAIHPGKVTSTMDGKVRYVGASELLRLYGLQRDEAVVIDESNRGRADYCDLIHLYPRGNGIYHQIPRDPDTQLALWSMGISLHAIGMKDSGGCCPDFSCCHPLDNPTPYVMKTRFITAYYQRDLTSMMLMKNMFIIASYMQTSPNSIVVTEGEDDVTFH